MLKILKQKDLKAFRDKELNRGSKLDFLVKEEIKNPVLDHCHTTGKIRGVLDRETNQFLGKCESNFKRFIKWKFPNITLPSLLIFMAQYLQMPEYEILHPKYVSLKLKKFSRYPKSTQRRILLDLKIKYTNELSKDELTKLYKEYFLSEENIYKL